MSQENEAQDHYTNTVQQLTDADIITVTTRGKLDLTDNFRSDWRQRVEQLKSREAKEYLGLLFDTDPKTLRIKRDESDEFAVTQSGTLVGKWPSETALVADVAAFVTFQEWLPEWGDLTGEMRDELVGRLRVFFSSGAQSVAERLKRSLVMR
jgi:hypothetical protein